MSILTAAELTAAWGDVMARPQANAAAARQRRLRAELTRRFTANEAIPIGVTGWSIIEREVWRPVSANQSPADVAGTLWNMATVIDPPQDLGGAGWEQFLTVSRGRLLTVQRAYEDFFGNGFLDQFFQDNGNRLLDNVSRVTYTVYKEA